MDRESLHKDGLLERYLLGLTSRKESQDIEEYLKMDPLAQADLDHLREQLGVYLDERGIDEKTENYNPKGNGTVDDQEVLKYLLHRNQSLNILRYVLLGLCLLSMAAAVYFFRSSKTFEAQLLSEKASHAQDRYRYRDALKEMDRQTVRLDAMLNIVTETEVGYVQLHYLPEDSIVLIDLSHLDVPQKGYAYHLYAGGVPGGEARYVVPPDRIHALYPLERHNDQLVISYGPAQAAGPGLPDRRVPVIRLDLEATITAERGRAAAARPPNPE